MTTFLFLLWAGVGATVQTEVVPMPNLETCNKVKEHILEHRPHKVKEFLGTNTYVSKPLAAYCEEF